MPPEREPSARRDQDQNRRNRRDPSRASKMSDAPLRAAPILQGTELLIARRAVREMLVRGIVDGPLASRKRRQDFPFRASDPIWIRVRASEQLIDFIRDDET